MTVSTTKLWPRRDRRETPRNGGQEAEAGNPIASRGRPTNEHARGSKKIAFFLVILMGRISATSALYRQSCITFTDFNQRLT